MRNRERERQRERLIRTQNKQFHTQLLHPVVSFSNLYADNTQEFSDVEDSWSALRLKAEADSSSRGQKDFILEKRKERLHGGRLKRDPETSGPVGWVGNWVFIALFYCPRVEMSLWCLPG
jgi:hypothetical protein